jgi:hypothetical protein
MFPVRPVFNAGMICGDKLSQPTNGAKKVRIMESEPDLA